MHFIHAIFFILCIYLEQFSKLKIKHINSNDFLPQGVGTSSIHDYIITRLSEFKDPRIWVMTQEFLWEFLLT